MKDMNKRRGFRRKNPFLAILTYLLGVFLVLGWLWLVVVLLPHFKDRPVVVFLVLLTSALVILNVFSLSRRMNTKVVEDLPTFLAWVKKSGRSLFMYLREFSTDAEYTYESNIINDKNSEGTFEESVARALEDEGILLAVGRPDERFPTSGGFRLYLEDEEWQRTISKLITMSDVILLRCGDRPGVTWELEQVIKEGFLSRTVFVAFNESKAKVVVERLKMCGFRPIQENWWPPEGTPEAPVVYRGTQNPHKVHPYKQVSINHVRHKEPENPYYMPFWIAISGEIRCFLKLFEAIDALRKAENERPKTSK